MAGSRQTLPTFFLKIIMLGFLGGGIYLLLLYASLDRNAVSNNYNAAQLDKLRLLENVPSPRLILVGGSNLAFGVDSERLERDLGVAVVNMGHQASLGLHYMMDTVLRLARRGDCVLLVPEYEHLGQDIFYGGSAIIDLIGYTGNMALLRYNGLIGLLAANTGIRHHQRKVVYYPPYTRDSFNRYGDNTAHLSRGPSKIIPYTIGAGVDPRPVNKINTFVHSCEQRGIRVLVSYPAAMHSFYLINRVMVDKLSANLRGAHVPLLVSNPREFVFDDNLFFDTVYHLNARGRAMRTDKLVDLLRKHPEYLGTSGSGEIK